MSARVLIVDDDPVARSICVFALKSQGYDVVPVPGPEQALQRLHAETFDLIVSDLMMPDMDGVEMATLIRRQDHLVDLPIIFITSREDREARMRVLTVGDALMYKPVDVLELFVCIDRLLRSRSRVLALRQQVAHDERTGLCAKLPESDAEAVASERASVTVAPPRRAHASHAHHPGRPSRQPSR